MGLRDHFRPPLDNLRHWEGFHAAWPVMIVADLNRRMPARYRALPSIQLANSAEIYEAYFVDEDDATTPAQQEKFADTLRIPPSFSCATTLPTQAIYEVRVYADRRSRHLVAAIEFIAPPNKEGLERRRAFVAKCAALLQERVSDVLIDAVTTYPQNLYAELLELIGTADPSLTDEPLYAASCRMTKRDANWTLETWTWPLTLDQPLPTLPLWLAADLAVPLDQNASYEQSCEVLGLP